MKKMKKVLSLAIAFCVIITSAISSFAAGPVDILNLVASESGVKYRPGDIITLSADFSNVEENIEKVQFLEGDNVIGESTTGVNGVYTYNYRALKTVTVTAKAIGADDAQIATTDAVIVNASFDTYGDDVASYEIPEGSTMASLKAGQNGFSDYGGDISVSGDALLFKSTSTNAVGKNQPYTILFSKVAFSGKVAFEITVNLDKTQQDTSNWIVSNLFNLKDSSSSAWTDWLQITRSGRIFVYASYSNNNYAVYQIPESVDTKIKAIADLNNDTVDLYIDDNLVKSNISAVLPDSVSEWRLEEMLRDGAIAEGNTVENYYSDISIRPVIESPSLPELCVVNADELKDDGTYLTSRFWSCKLYPSLIVHNNSYTDKTIDFIVAVYNSNGELIKVSKMDDALCAAKKTTELKSDELIIECSDANSTIGAASLRIFALNDLTSLAPIATYGDVQLAYGR